jgi:hypothetical protein
LTDFAAGLAVVFAKPLPAAAGIAADPFPLAFAGAVVFIGVAAAPRVFGAGVDAPAVLVVAAGFLAAAVACFAMGRF